MGGGGEKAATQRVSVGEMGEGRESSDPEGGNSGSFVRWATGDILRHLKTLLRDICCFPAHHSSAKLWWAYTVALTYRCSCHFLTYGVHIVDHVFLTYSSVYVVHETAQDLTVTLNVQHAHSIYGWGNNLKTLNEWGREYLYTHTDTLTHAHACTSTYVCIADTHILIPLKLSIGYNWHHMNHHKSIFKLDYAIYQTIMPQTAHL